MYKLTVFFVSSLIGLYIFKGTFVGKCFIVSSVFFGLLWLMYSVHLVVKRIINWKKRHEIKRYIPNTKCENPIKKIQVSNYPQVVWVICYTKPKWEVMRSGYELHGKLDPERVKFGYVLCANCGALFNIGLTTNGDAVLKCLKCGQEVVVYNWFLRVNEVENLALAEM